MAVSLDTKAFSSAERAAIQNQTSKKFRRVCAPKPTNRSQLSCKRQNTRPFQFHDIGFPREIILPQPPIDDFAVGQSYIDINDDSNLNGEEAPQSTRSKSTPIRILDSQIVLSKEEDTEQELQEMIRYQCSTRENVMYQRLATRGISVTPPDEELIETDCRLTNKLPINESESIPSRRLSRKRSSAEMLFAMDALELGCFSDPC